MCIRDRHQTIKYLVENNVTVYQYLLTYQGEYSASPMFGVPAHNGVCHGDDHIYLWVMKSLGLTDITSMIGNSIKYSFYILKDVFITFW